MRLPPPAAGVQMPLVPLLLHLQFIFASPNGPDSPSSPEKEVLPQGGDTAICAAVTTGKPIVKKKKVKKEKVACPILTGHPWLLTGQW